MKLMKSALAIAALSVAATSGAFALDGLGGKNNSTTIKYFEAVVSGQKCAQSKLGVPLLLSQGASNHIPWVIVDGICGKTTGTCTAQLMSYDTTAECDNNQGTVLTTATIDLGSHTVSISDPRFTVVGNGTPNPVVTLNG